LWQQQQKTANDIVAEYPDNAKVVFENKYVQVVKFNLEPGDKLPLHKGGKRVVYAVYDFKVKWTEGNETSEKEWQNGDAHWHDAIEHAIENIGDTIASYLVVMRKDTLLPETGEYDVSRDASQLDSEHSKIIFDNDHVRVIDVKLGSGESQPKHEGIYRLIYSLSD
jgi:quercetin dioxygenase-like cupin family protein